jgi:hypothetical protein
MSGEERRNRPPAVEAPTGAQPLRIVVADDDRDMVLTLKLLLQDEGHQVRGLCSGRKVLSAVPVPTGG